MSTARRVCPECGHHTVEPACPFDGTATAETAPSWLGRTIDGRYRLDEPLGEGGMGAVFRATQLPVERPVAVKMLRAAEASAATTARFRREARAIAALRHPQIVQLIEFGEAETGEHYLVMELIGGRTLEDVIEQEAPLSAERVARIGAGIAKGLACAHDGGVVHRDLKPANIMLTDHAGEPDFVRILDFGIAQLAGPEAAASYDLTGTHAILGTPRYLSPEQARGAAVSPQTDLYALGLILYELCRGRSPFEANSLTGWLMAHAQDPPEPLPDDIGPLGALIMRCLSKDPTDRPSSARAVLKALETARRTAGGSRRVGRARPLVWGLAAAVAGAAVVTVVAISQLDGTPPPSAAAAPIEDPGETADEEEEPIAAPTELAVESEPEASPPEATWAGQRAGAALIEAEREAAARTAVSAPPPPSASTKKSEKVRKPRSQRKTSARSRPGSSVKAKAPTIRAKEEAGTPRAADKVTKKPAPGGDKKARTGTLTKPGRTEL